MPLIPRVAMNPAANFFVPVHPPEWENATFVVVDRSVPGWKAQSEETPRQKAVA